MPPSETCISSMTSNSADCVFGDVLLISSANTIFENIGPLLKVNFPVPAL